MEATLNANTIPAITIVNNAIAISVSFLGVISP